MLRPPSHATQRTNTKPKRNCLKISLGILNEWRKRKLRDCSRLLLSTFPVHRKHANNCKHTTEWQKRFGERAGTRNEPSGISGIVRDRSHMSHLCLGVSPSLLLISSRNGSARRDAVREIVECVGDCSSAHRRRNQFGLRNRDCRGFAMHFELELRRK